MATLKVNNLNLNQKLKQVRVINVDSFFILDFLEKCYPIFDGTERDDSNRVVENWLSVLLKGSSFSSETTLYERKPKSVNYLVKYYLELRTLGNTLLLRHPKILGPISYYLILNNKHLKVKYTLNDINGVTQTNVSIGGLLKYFGTYKKSLKKSVKAHLLLVRFIKNSLKSLIKNANYVFIMRGLNLKFFKFMSFYGFCKKNTNMVLYFIEPKISNNRVIGKKSKSIKKKFQKKNLIKVNKIYSFYKNNRGGTIRV